MPDRLSGATPEEGPKINASDMSIPGRDFDGSGNFTPTKDNLYRDFTIAEAGATVCSLRPPIG